ncbi:tRNA3(Ser)-specific nuclease WapA precursor [Clostridium puniceum]|uniref:tRNA3(Ser)-specific nuclease WapA n=1 Tax=Clostridium puniceum TaxID=29367 RepID=A0A1S8TNU6_9CLOT|nr:RHS repeat-associated core domain-containing protein [Clostridium puniceum]OOM79262.1 tRNA3(Ser)-specific nuclease WapA precursor [Clostridium puniceum]
MPKKELQEKQELEQQNQKIEKEENFNKNKLNVIDQRFKYNPDGTLKNAYTGNMQYEYSYNIEGMLESKSASGRALLTYTYDKNNNIKSIKDITGKSSIYSYDDTDRVNLIQDDNQINIAIYDYYKNDNIKSVTVGNGLKTDYTYDGDGNIKSLVTISSTGEVLVDYDYAYDLNGNRLQKVSSKQKNFYSYDSMNRLKEASYDNRCESFTYDKVGNRLTNTTNDITEKYMYNVKNQLKELHRDSGINYFTYDKQGNTIKEETTTGNNIFEYNTLNQQVKAITKDGNTLVSRYDTEGLRAEIEENEKLTKFIFHKENVLVETDKDFKVISRFARGYEVVAADISEFGEGSEANLNRYYYTVDEQGSTIFISDTNQRVKNEYYHDAFGNVLDSKEEVHNRITYTGQQFDGITGQYYLRARFYNPVIGRFTQEDIYRGDGLNLYAYCGNNAVRYYDPSGYSCETKASAFGEMSHEDGKRYREHWESLNNGNVDYESKIRNYRGIDLGGVDPKYLADPKYIVEMPYVGKNKKNSNSQGWKRDSKFFFKELQSKHPEIFGKKNTSLIKKGSIPIVDEKFIEHFPQYADNLDEVIRHHHIGGGGQAMPIPDTLHPGYGGIHNVEKEIGILTDHTVDGLFADEAEKLKNSTVRTKNWKRIK